MFKVVIKSSTEVVYVSVVISNVLGGCPVSLGVIKAAGGLWGVREWHGLYRSLPPRAPRGGALEIWFLWHSLFLGIEF